MGGEACESSTAPSRSTGTAMSSGSTGSAALMLVPPLAGPATATSSGRGSTGLKLPRVRVSELREMRRLYEQEGASLKDIAGAVGRSIATVHRHLKAAGVQMNPSHQQLRPMPNALPHREVLRTVVLYEAGLTAHEVGVVLGGLSEATVRHRLDTAGVRRRSQSEAQGRSPRRVRLAPEVEDEVVRLYEVELLSQKAVAARLGIAGKTVYRALARRGVRLRSRSESARIQRARLRGERPTLLAVRRLRMAVVETGDAGGAETCTWMREYVPAPPLVRAIALAAPRLGGERQIAYGAGTTARMLYSWRSGERREATWEMADRVMLSLGVMWWDVFDPADATPRSGGSSHTFSGVRSRDVVGWIAAAFAAVEAWGDDE